ncbi:MAG: metallophosphoesterase [Planctomycetota bacterium]
MTDSHFHGGDRAALRFLAELAADQQFDLVLWTGDLIDNPCGVASMARAAALFRPRIGSFAVLGGHDYATVNGLKAYTHLFWRIPQEAFGAPNASEELKARLRKAGVRLIEDGHVSLRARDGQSFALVGLRDAFVFAPDFEAAWDGLPADVPVIVMAHCPDVLPQTCARGARLAFFGHTHGGQVRLPLVGALVTRSSLPGRLASGTFRHGGTVFVMNNGLGTSPAIGFRLLCRPEVTVAEIRKAPAAGTTTAIEEARLG